MKTGSKNMNIQGLFVVAAMLTFVAVEGFAQFPEDALRFAAAGTGVGARALGMGNAYTGVASDYSALYWNPAGLAQMEHSEFSFGLSYLNNRDQSAYLGTSQSYNNNSTTLNALGLVFPVEVRRGSLVFAFGYNRQSNFTTGVSFEAFNPSSSILQTYNRNGAPTNGNPYGVAWELYLADTARDAQRNPIYYSPIINRVTQIGKVLEGGGLNNYSVGGAMDVAKNISVGGSINYVSGTYKYDRSYKEQDTKNVYSSAVNGSPLQFDQFTQDDFVESDLTGFNAKLGLMYRVPDRFRFGINIKTPTTLSVKESFGSTYKAYFDNGDIVAPDASTNSGEYDVATPWVFSVGASGMFHDLVLSGDIEYTDWTELEFRNANPDVIALNKDIKDIFRATLNFRAGGEYDIKQYGVRVRGGFIYNTSPYRGDPSSFDQKYYTAGLGFLLGDDTMLDVAFAHGWWKTYRYNYSGSPQLAEDVATNNLNLTFSFRF